MAEKGRLRMVYRRMAKEVVLFTNALWPGCSKQPSLHCLLCPSCFATAVYTPATAPMAAESLQEKFKPVFKGLTENQCQRNFGRRKSYANQDEC